MLRRTLWFALASWLLAPTVSAHGGGFGAPVETRVDLPAWLVWAAGATVVAVSFVVVAAFLTREKETTESEDARPAPPTDGRVGVGPWVGFAAWTLILANAFVPANDGGLAPVWFWIGVWILVPILQYAVGDVWRRVNPFLVLGTWADRLRGARRPLAYPRRLGAWPAAVLLLIFIGIEVAAPGAQDARTLAAFLTAYTALAFFGMLYFGSSIWLANAEVLTRTFTWWAAAAPRDPDGGWAAPGARLDRLRVEEAGGVAFAVALLFGVNYDGLLATGIGRQATAVAGGAVLVLVGGFLVFLAVWHACVWAVRRAALSLDAHAGLARRFAPALLPIAVGYHAAHNVFYAWENLPRMAGALADPFGLGWSFAPFSAAADRWPLATEYAGWFAAAQVLLILAGHVVAVIVAHRLAFGAFPSRLQAVRGEVPLTAVMVVYTLAGLSILSQAAAAVGT